MGKSKRPAEDEVEVGDTTMEVDAATTEQPKHKKSKKEGEEKEIPKEALSPIAVPLAGKKVGKKVLKLVKKGAFTLLGSLCQGVLSKLRSDSMLGYRKVSGGGKEENEVWGYREGGKEFK